MTDSPSSPAHLTPPNRKFKRRMSSLTAAPKCHTSEQICGSRWRYARPRSVLHDLSLPPNSQFFAMVSLVLSMNERDFRGWMFVSALLNSGLVAVGMLSTCLRSSALLVLYIIGQVLMFGFELNDFLKNLSEDISDLCESRIGHKGTAVVVTEKLYSFAFIVVTCYAAETLRHAIQQKQHHLDYDPRAHELLEEGNSPSANLDPETLSTIRDALEHEASIEETEEK